jgi:hypothetical protein
MGTTIQRQAIIYAAYFLIRKCDQLVFHDEEWVNSGILTNCRIYTLLPNVYQDSREGDKMNWKKNQADKWLISEIHEELPWGHTLQTEMD